MKYFYFLASFLYIGVMATVSQSINCTSGYSKDMTSDDFTLDVCQQTCLRYDITFASGGEQLTYVVTGCASADKCNTAYCSNGSSIQNNLSTYITNSTELTMLASLDVSSCCTACCTTENCNANSTSSIEGVMCASDETTIDETTTGNPGTTASTTTSGVEKVTVMVITRAVVLALGIVAALVLLI